MSVDVQALKAAVDFPSLVEETHRVHGRKVLCPFHDDHNPSCHIYPNGYKCYSCGARGDVITWLERIYDLNTRAAIQELKTRTGVSLDAMPPKWTLTRPDPLPVDKPCKAVPVSEGALSAHRRRAARLDRVPEAVRGRGFDLSDLRQLEFADENGTAVFPIYDPGGVVVGIKLRLWGSSKVRYYNLKREHEGPAWCSPNFGEHDTVLVVEGELNGMACWLARTSIAVMGAAGTGCDLHLSALKSKTVFVYSDADEAGERARQRWAEQAYRTGAGRVFVLEPWHSDACDIAGGEGRAVLAELLTRSLETASTFDAVSCFDAKGVCIKHKPSLTQKPALMFSCKGFSGRPHLRGKPCL